MKALDNLDMQIDCVIVAVAHDENLRFSFSTGFLL